MARLVMKQWRAPSHELRSKLRLEGGGLGIATTHRWDIKVLGYGPQVAHRIQEGGSSYQQKVLRPEVPFKSTK